MLNNTGIGSATWLEIAWTLAAIPGFVLWAKSWFSARQSLKAVRNLKYSNGRLLWAKFSLQLTSVMLIIEFAFITIGVIAMSLQTNPSSNPTYSLIISVVLISSSVFISLLAYRWREVEAQILEMARIRLAEKASLAALSDTLTKREATQNTRDTDQNLRDVRQDERDEK